MARPYKTDYIGQTHGCWKVIERDFHPKSKSHETFWICECQNCGNITSVRKTILDQNPRSCNKCKGKLISQALEDGGYVKHIMRPGDRYGFLTVLERPKSNKEVAGNDLYVKCRCDCGRVLDIRKSHLIGRDNGQRRTISCGCATKTSGEIKVAEILKANNVEYKEQYRIKEFNISAPFDFAVFNDDELMGLIEYDGQQHFYAIDHFGGEERLKMQQEIDRRKNKWCEENDINLLRIPYTDYNKIDINYIFPEFPNLKFSS